MSVKHEVLTEHSGCGSNAQVDRITVRLNPGDKVVLIKRDINAAPPQPAGLAVEASERERFEAWMLTQGYGPKSRICSAGSPCEGEYTNQYWHRSWVAWLAAKTDAAHQQAPQAVVDTERLDCIESAKHAHSCVRWSDELGCWLAPGGFEHSTFREAIDEVLDAHKAIAARDAARRSTRADGDAASAGQGEVSDHG